MSEWPEKVVIHTDGASRGNPGAAAIGIAVSDEGGETVFEFGKTLGEQTNNFAEYMAVQEALKLALENGVSEVHLKSDSQLLIRQLNGEYKVKSETLRPLYLECLKLGKQLGHVKFEHVRREFNKRADELANQALDSDF